jgi:hypothetical protein
MANSQDNCVFGWSCRKQRLAERVVVRNYNPEEPSLDVSDTTAIDSRGQGTEYIYGQNVQTDTEATYLSQIRAEEQICRKTQFFGESSVSRLQAGYLFMLDQHPNTKYNATEYLAIEVNHEGHNLDMSIAHDANKKTRPQYQNSFVAISADVQYRPPLKTIKPRITGNLHARIDGEVLSEYAQLDSEGRYKVSMPFDFHNDDHPEGLASARVRMIQPYAGENRGMQFPMAKGTEVLLSFVDGDPDRPIIAGAINTAAAPGPVTADNQTESVIQTGGNNKIRMEDKFGSERVMLESPAANSWIRVGATNDPITLQGESPLYVDIGATFTDPGAVATDSTDPANPIVTAPFNAQLTSDATGAPATTGVSTAIAGEFILTYTDSTNTSNTATRRVIVCDGATSDLLGNASDGIRVRSAGNLWLEARSKYGDYHLAPSPLEGRSLPRSGGNSIGDLYDKFIGSAASYVPTGMKDMAGNSQTSFKTNTLPKAHLHVSSLDTITTQEGNIYDFGGYWNYNLGNSYAEDHLNQKGKLNYAHVYDLLEPGPPGTNGVIWRTTGSRTGISSATGISETENAKSPIVKNPNIVAHIDSAWTSIWVQKTLGDSYEYTEGSTISVAKGSTQEIEIGGVHIEEAYRGDGSKKSYSSRGISGEPSKEKKWTGKGTLIYESETTKENEFINDLEKKYDRNTGALYSHTHTQGTGMGLAKFEFDYSNTVALTVNSGSLLSSETFLGAKITNENYIGAAISIGTFLGGKIDMGFALAGILEIRNTKVGCEFPGTSIEATGSKIDTVAADLKTIGTSLNAMGAKINAGTTDIEAIAAVKLTA